MPTGAQGPLVTVALATYNSVGYLRESVGSILAQTVSDWELIIVDDGSIDGTREWLGTLRDPRIRCIFEPHCGNTAYLRNLGIRAGSAPWVAIQDSDDLWAPNKLERHLAFHREHPAVRWSYSGRKLMDAAGQILPDEKYRKWQPVSGWIVKEVLVFDAMIATPSMFVARSLFEEAGGFDERFRTAAERLLLLDLAMLSECGAIDEPLITVRLHAGSWTYRNGETCAGLADTFGAFADRAPTPELKALSLPLENNYRVRAALYWTDAREWANAAGALVAAIRRRPFQTSAYRMAARLVVKRIGSRGLLSKVQTWPKMTC